MRLAQTQMLVYKLPYPRPVRWKDTVEDGGLFMLLRLTTEEGYEGVAEGPIKPTWTGTTPRSLAATVEDLLVPALEGVDLADAVAVRSRLERFPENTLAKGLVDNACWDLRAQLAGEPLWALWKGTRDVALSWTVTREAPQVMAQEAAEMVGRYGFRTLKIKGGQGFETDARALREIRAAVGSTVALYVDANAAYRPDETPAYLRLLAEAGATHAEDPCDLRPDAWFERTQAESPLPLVVDSRCQTLADARLFLERGARAFGIKPTRVGATQALETAREGDRGNARVNVGLHAESALGSIAATHVAAAFAHHADSLPAETSYYLAYSDQILREPPQIRDGMLHLEDKPGFAALIDWDRLARYTV
jgi:L-alanine-DL-glutamate epimerase-like enolase superfamily enzyme